MDDITSEIKTALGYLHDVMLDNMGVHREYTDYDLSMAAFVFAEFMLAKMYTHQLEEGLNTKQMMVLADECGKSIRQTVELFTGCDLHQAVKEAL